MIRSGKKLFSTVLASVAAASLSACGGGGSHSASLPQTAPTSAAAAAPYTGPLADATFKITIPGPQSSAFKRRPSYVSSATKSVRFVINSSSTVSGTATTGTLGAYNLLAWRFFDTGTLPNANCPVDGSHAGNFTCTVTLKLPPGTDNVTVSACDATGGACISPGTVSGNVLSQQIQNLTVVAGTTNSFTMTLDANASTMVASGTAACASGPVGASFGSVGTSAVNFTVAYTDAQSKTIVNPGIPILQIQGNDALYHPDSGTINGTGGTVGFTINQAAQTFTLTPSTAPLTNATVNIKSTPKNTNGSSDGLGFSKTQSFVFSTGNAPPASFLALIEQTGAASGKVDLFTINTTNSTFAVSNVAGGGNVLAVTNSTNEGKPDIDNPRDIVFDTGGNLLIANGGQGGTGGDFGDFACIPAGAIATGSTTTTTSSADARDPESIAFNAGDSSVTIGNVPASATYNTVRYLLTNTYAEGTTSQNIANVGTVGATSVISIPSLAAGTFAAAITNGTTTSRIVLKGPTGTETSITDTDISSPEALGWDNSANQQIAVANHQIVTTPGPINHNRSKLAFFTTAGAKVKAVQLGTDPVTSTDSYMFGDKIAVSADGHVAVAGGTADGPAQVRVFDNVSANRTQIGGPIPFDSYTNNTCVTGNFGNVTVVHSMRWLTNNLLLIMLQANGAGKQGAYIYDISQLVATPGLYEYDGNNGNCNAVTLTSPKQTGFQAITNAPLSAAYKP